MEWKDLPLKFRHRSFRGKRVSRWGAEEGCQRYVASSSHITWRAIKGNYMDMTVLLYSMHPTI